MKKVRNQNKTGRRGTARLADGAKLFGPGDDTHVERTTPRMTKIKQQLSAEDAGIDPVRDSSTRNRRADKETKPI